MVVDDFAIAGKAPRTGQKRSSAVGSGAWLAQGRAPFCARAAVTTTGHEHKHNMIATLDTFRDTLEGDTDPVSGPVVLELK